MSVPLRNCLSQSFVECAKQLLSHSGTMVRATLRLSSVICSCDCWCLCKKFHNFGILDISAIWVGCFFRFSARSCRLRSEQEFPCRLGNVISNNSNIIEISRNGGFFVVNVFTSVCVQVLVKQTFGNILPSADQLLAMSHGNISNRNRSLILNSRFLQRPQKRSQGNQLIHKRL